MFITWTVHDSELITMPTSQDSLNTDVSEEEFFFFVTKHQGIDGK